MSMVLTGSCSFYTIIITNTVYTIIEKMSKLYKWKKIAYITIALSIILGSMSVFLIIISKKTYKRNTISF